MNFVSTHRYTKSPFKIDEHPPQDKRTHSPGCGEQRALRWKGLWCNQRCAAQFATRILPYKVAREELYCRVCGTKGCHR